MESKGIGKWGWVVKILDLPSDYLERFGKWMIDLRPAYSSKSGDEILVEIISFCNHLSFVEVQHFNLFLQIAFVNLGEELGLKIYMIPWQFVGNDTSTGLKGTDHFIRYDLMILMEVIKGRTNHNIGLEGLSGFDQNIQYFLSYFRELTDPVIEN